MSPNLPPASPPIKSSPPVLTASVPPRFPFVLLFLVWLATVAVATLVTFILPESFASTARLLVETDQPDIGGAQERTNAYDARFVLTQSEIIRSETILGRVIDTLNLNEIWSKKYMDGSKLKTSESLALLRARLDVRQVPNTSLLDIRVYSESPMEARDLANSIADTYRQWRYERSYGERNVRLQTLEEHGKELDESINRLQLDMATPGDGNARGDTQKPSFMDKQKRLDELTEQQREITRQIAVAKTDLLARRRGPVEVIERAVASVHPFRPNKPLNIALGFVFGGVAGFSLALLVYIFKHSAHKRQATMW